MSPAPLFGRRVGRPAYGPAKINADKTACDRGHPFDEANTHHWTDSDGYQHRQCRACNRFREAQRHRNRREST